MLLPAILISQWCNSKVRLQGKKEKKTKPQQQNKTPPLVDKLSHGAIPIKSGFEKCPHIYEADRLSNTKLGWPALPSASLLLPGCFVPSLPWAPTGRGQKLHTSTGKLLRPLQQAVFLKPFGVTAFPSWEIRCGRWHKAFLQPHIYTSVFLCSKDLG